MQLIGDARSPAGPLDPRANRMTAVACAFLLIASSLSCSRSPTSPSTQPDQTARWAASSSGIQLIVETTGSNLPTQLSFFVCSDPGMRSKSIGLSFLCRFTASAFGTLTSNGDVVTQTAAGIWRAGLELPGNCRPNAPFADFYNHTVISPIVTVARNALTPMTFSIACL